MKNAAIAVALIAAGCASNPGVAPMGQDTFMVSRQAATGFTGIGDLKVEALREADQYCQARQQQMQVVSATENRPPYIFGNFPRAEVQFKCLAPK